MSNLDWMAWTPVTAAFFIALFAVLALMTWLAVARPEIERKGILGIATTRGDRLFITLLGSVIIHLIWLSLFGADPIGSLPIGEGVPVSALWGAVLASCFYGVGVFRAV
jgi:predicted small integral membrane protein